MNCPHCGVELKIQISLFGDNLEQMISLKDRVLTHIGSNPGIPYRELLQKMSKSAGAEELKAILKSLEIEGKIAIEVGPKGGARYHILLEKPREAFPGFGV